MSNRKKGILFIVSAPAGTGKTTLVEMVVKEFNEIVRNISYTTRKMRKGEKQGVDYHFISREEFEKKIANNEMLEHVTLYGDYYGTAYESVERLLNFGKHVILVIDTQGALKLKNHTDTVFIFIEPPSLEELERRLFARKTEDLAAIKKRIEWAANELKQKSFYDYAILNDELNKSYEVLKSIIIAEEHRIH